MSLANLCDRDEITVQTLKPVRGKSFGTSYTVAESRTLRCAAQELDAQEVLDFAARGMKVSHQFFFTADPGVGQGHRIIHNGKMIEVRGAYSEGRPGPTLLWIVLGEHTTAPKQK